ncbi:MULTISPECIES: M24 family metallopeptidase [unclassified Sinorhizobium]|uniref:M24 family metallopeptidase n=1 Tax=unclassified Sinorhizobium TaxID=2613772 RepID=UPI003523A684
MPGISHRKMYPISTAELERRWSALRQQMAEKKIDVLYTFSTNEWSSGYIKWLTDRMPGNGIYFSIIFPRDEEMTVVGPGGFGGDKRLPPGGDDVLRGVKRAMSAPYFLGATFSEAYLHEATETALEEFAGATIGLVGPGMIGYTLMDYLRRGKLANARIIDATDIVDGLMVIKSDEEIAAIRRSAELQDQAFEAVLAQARPGMRDFEITTIADQVARLGGSETGLLSGASAPIGSGVQMQFRQMQNRMMNKGDQFTLLIETAGPGGFFCELGRTFLFGRATQKMKDEVNTVIEAQKLTTEMLGAGASCADVWEAHNRFLRERGRPEEDRLYAHGQGYFLVERPLIRFDERMPIRPRMNVAVHPMYRHEGNLTWMCDNFLIGDNGTERLHRTPQHIFEID